MLNPREKTAGVKTFSGRICLSLQGGRIRAESVPFGKIHFPDFPRKLVLLTRSLPQREHYSGKQLDEFSKTREMMSCVAVYILVEEEERMLLAGMEFRI